MGTNKTKEIMDEFEYMREMAEIKALSKLSLETPLNDEQYKRFIELGIKLGLKEK